MSEVRLSHICDLSALAQVVADGLVRTQIDPTAKFRIFNYSPEAQYSRTWTPEVRMSRGLIVRPDDPSHPGVVDGIVVARPFEKYFNVGEPDAPAVPQTNFVVADKLDGSLGIVYVDRDDATPVVRVATRGSFASPQAQAATRWLASTHPHWVPEEGLTYLFEWIAPENRIVLDYGARRELVLLAIIDNATGADLPLPGSWPAAVAPHLDGVSYFEEVLDMMSSDAPSDGGLAEGFVIRFDHGPDRPATRLKIKYAEYVTLHRLITGTNARSLWQVLVADRLAGLDPVTLAWAIRASAEDLALIQESGGLAATLSQLPDELYSWADEIVAGLEADYERIVSEHLAATDDLRALGLTERKDLAAAVKTIAKERGLNPGLLFDMFDERIDRWRASVWRSLRPETDNVLNPIAASFEDVA